MQKDPNDMCYIADMATTPMSSSGIAKQKALGDPAKVESQTATGICQEPLQATKPYRTLLLTAQTLPPLHHKV
jgi:hypothetical protein